MRVALAVFVKTPALSAVKTRLAAAIGKQQAEQFFYLAQAATAALLQQSRQEFAAKGVALTTFWAVAEQAGLNNPLWHTAGIRRIYTGEGGLGERMHHVYHQLLADHDAVLLIGMDSPQNTPAILWQACEYLQEPDQLVFGPARDGGFYLLGGNQPVPLHHWTAVEYSMADTLAQFVGQLAQQQISYLPVLTDVDEQRDLLQLCAEMPARPLPEQQAVLEFCQHLAVTAL